MLYFVYLVNMNNVLKCFIVQKNIIFQILYIIVASLKRFIVYKVPPSDKCSLLLLANWHSAL